MSAYSRNQFLQSLLTSQHAGTFFDPLRVVSLQTNQVLYEEGDNIDYVYFPLTSVVSTLGIMEDGTTVETAMVGSEGLVGIAAILGAGVHRQWSWVSISGDAVQVEAKRLNRLFVHNEDALKLLLSYYQSLILQVSQRCICNTRHTILQRLSCWLLMMHDRNGKDDLRLTQEMIASRVGARRSGISLAAGVLQEVGAIEYRRGQVYILDPHALKEAACECYSMIQLKHPQTESLTPSFHPSRVIT